jgi:hypothetical protein
LSASYPASVRTFVSRTDFSDILLADHVNSLQNEVSAVEQAIGVSPGVSTSPSPSTGFMSGATYATLIARLANIENGIVGDTHTQYLKKTGGTVSGALTVTGNLNATGGITGHTIPAAFHLGGVLTTGTKIPRFIIPMACKLDMGLAFLASGTSATYEVFKNGVGIAATVTVVSSGATNTAVFTGLTFAAGDTVQIAVNAISGTPSDLSVTLSFTTT